jgi:hypothetical protein
MKKECGICDDECNPMTECQCDHENQNPKPHHRHPMPGEVEAGI